MGLRASVVGIVFCILCAAGIGASASPQRLDCVLTDTDVQPQSEKRSIVVVFDEGNKTLTATDGDHTYSLQRVSISNVSIAGQADDVSVGVDRSSLGIVWQRYDAEQVRNEFGYCRAANSPT